MGFWDIREGDGLFMKRQRGSLTIEAALVLGMFLFAYAAIISITNFIRAQMIIQYSLGQAAKEISAYCYLVSKTGLLDDSARVHSEAETFKNDTDEVIDTVVKLYEALDEGADSISSSVTAIPECTDLDELISSIEEAKANSVDVYTNVSTSAKTAVSTGEAYFSNPAAILKGICSVGKDEAFSDIKTYLIAAPISKALVARQIGLYGQDSQGRDVLERLGVVGGMDGISFAGSTLFNDGETICVSATYAMKLPFGILDKEFYFNQAASTRAWGAGK